MTKFEISMRWMVVLGGLSSAIAMAALPVVAQAGEGVDERGSGLRRELSRTRVGESEPPNHLSTHLLSTPQSATTVEAWLAQIEASLTQITGVRVEETEAGLQVMLETAGGEVATPTTSVSGDALILEIPNAVLAGEAFEQFEPAAGIALVQVSALPGDRVQVVITGTDAVPEVVVGSDVAGLTLSVVPGVAQAGETDDAIQIVVTGDVDEGYNPQSASTATRTDTPLRDIPQSIQVVPRQVLEDRRPSNITEAVETVSGVVDAGNNFGSPSGARIIRGFSQGFAEGASGGNYRNGFRDGGFFTLTGIGTVERIEVLRGPASVVFGSAEPGGIINVITRQPLSEPYYNIELEVGNRSFYQPSIDLSGPLDQDRNILYRFIASYQDTLGFQDFVNTDLTTIAPSIAVNFGDDTQLNIYYEYINFTGDPAEQYGGMFSDDSFLPENFFLGYPQFNFFEQTTQKFGYTLTHRFSENWQVRNGFSANITSAEDRRALGNELVNDRILRDFYTGDFEFTKNNYFGQIDVLGRFNTGSIVHQVLVGFDFNIFDGSQVGTEGGNLPDLDLFNPEYNVAAPVNPSSFNLDEDINSYGIYLQDQIELTDNLILLIGGRLDWVEQETEFIFDTLDFSSPYQSNNAFSPRIGLVYQPSDLVSIYTSYSRSFNPTAGFSSDDSAFEPTRGTQYEVGIRTDLLDGRFSTNLAAYHLTKSNITTAAPINPNLSIQVGEQRSQGIELDVTGEILPGWNIVASYAYTDAEITEDNTLTIGNQLVGVPEHQVSLWTTYEIQEGGLEGLGFGLGLFYVGERAGDLDNTFTIPSYLRTDAALYYRRDRLNAAINVRNLFDIDYFRSSDSGRIFLQRGAPFSIIGSLSWEF
ncbi:MAG: TonB-dependent siderophore receptor [Cyanobacteria bacterium J06639_16]